MKSQKKWPGSKWKPLIYIKRKDKDEGLIPYPKMTQSPLNKENERENLEKGKKKLTRKEKDEGPVPYQKMTQSPLDKENERENLEKKN